MSAKHTGLSVLAFTVDTVNFLGRLESVNTQSQGTMQSASGIADTYERSQKTKAAHRQTFTVMDDNGGRRWDALAAISLLVDGVELIGRSKSFTLNVNVPVADHGGQTDLIEFAAVVGARNVEISAEVNILASAKSDALLVDMFSGTVTNHEVTATINAGTGGALTLPVTLGNIDHNVNKGALQTLSLSMASRGAPTATPTGAILGTVFGDCLLSLVFDSGAGSYTQTGVIESFSMAVADGQITKQTVTVRFQGNATYAATP